MALFDLADFDGPIVKDMFDEDGYFADADQFWVAQSAEIEQRKAAYLEDGWSSVEIIPPGSHFNDWQYEKTPKRKGGRIYIQVRAKGEVIFHEGYLTDKEARKRDDETSGNIKQPAPARPEITSAITSYIDLHRHAAVRSALATRPSLALRVMVAHAICGSPLWRVYIGTRQKLEPDTPQLCLLSQNGIPKFLSSLRFRHRLSGPGHRLPLQLPSVGLDAPREGAIVARKGLGPMCKVQPIAG